MYNLILKRRKENVTNLPRFLTLKSIFHLCFLQIRQNYLLLSFTIKINCRVCSYKLMCGKNFNRLKCYSRSRYNFCQYNLAEKKSQKLNIASIHRKSYSNKACVIIFTLILDFQNINKKIK